MKLGSSVVAVLLPVVLIMGLTHSCISEEFEPDKLNNSVRINPNVAAPLGYLTFRLDSMLNDDTKPDLLVIHEDGTMTLRYRQHAFTGDISGKFKFKDVDTTISENNPIPPGTNLQSLGSDSLLYAYSYPIQLHVEDAPDIDIDSVWIKSLKVRPKLSSIDPDLNGYMVLSSGSIINLRDSFEMTLPFDEAGIEKSQTLDNYSIILDGNKMILNLLLVIKESNTNTPDLETFSLQFKISEIEFDAVFGYLGMDSLYPPTKDLDIGFFNTNLAGSFTFDEPQMNIYFENSIGIPLEVSFEDFYSTNYKYNTTVNIVGENIPTTEQPTLISYPKTYQVGDTLRDTIAIDLNKTNVPDLLEDETKLPNKITYSALGVINPLGIDSVNFITPNSYFSVDVELLLPLSGYTDLLILRDTLDFDFSTYYKKPPEEIKSLAFRVNFINSFPLDVNATMDFVDENYKKTTTLFSNGSETVKAGRQTGSDCRIESVKTNLDPFDLTNKIDSIAEAKYIIIVAAVSTPDWQHQKIINFCNSFSFEAYIGVIVDAEVNSADYQ